MYATVFVFGLVMVAVPAVRRLQAETPITPDRKQACFVNDRPLGYKIALKGSWHANCLSCEHRPVRGDDSDHDALTNTPSTIRLPERRDLGHPVTHRNSVTVTPKKLTQAEAARATGVSRTQILRAIKSGRLSSEKLEDGSVRIEVSELLRVWPDAD